MWRPDARQRKKHVKVRRRRDHTPDPRIVDLASLECLASSTSRVSARHRDTRAEPIVDAVVELLDDVLVDLPAARDERREAHAVRWISRQLLCDGRQRPDILIDGRHPDPDRPPGLP